MSARIVYWIATVAAAAFMLMTAIPDVLRIPQAIAVIMHLGYPPYLLLFLGMLAYVIQKILPASSPVVFGAFQGGNALEIGRSLFTVYLLPFEVTSVLILIAILGAIVLARKEVD